MSRMKRISLIVTGLTALSVGSMALAQGATSALKGHNADAPIDVAADRIEAQDRADRAIFSGNVKVRQAELTLDTQRLTGLFDRRRGRDQAARRERRGRGASPSETARGNFGIYDLDRKLITLIGAVQLNRGGSQINGQRLTIDLNSGRAVVDGGGPGSARAGAG